ncbi:MAG: response regulator transcription factor [Gemmatimonadetes bacterium]|nr:response regulator transcription factor [Gemmatimonadota bacterium]
MEGMIVADNAVRTTSVVIVDDSDIVRQRIRSMLTPRPHVEIVGEADDIASGREIIEEQKPDVVVLDVMMPGGSGLELLEGVKDGPEPPVVIVLTNYPYSVFRRRAMELGAEYFLAKSSEFGRIAEILEDLGRAEK